MNKKTVLLLVFIGALLVVFFGGSWLVYQIGDEHTKKIVSDNMSSIIVLFTGILTTLVNAIVRGKSD